jgi:hypothetical protein
MNNFYKQQEIFRLVKWGMRNTSGWLSKLDTAELQVFGDSEKTGMLKIKVLREARKYRRLVFINIDEPESGLEVSRGLIRLKVFICSFNFL